MDKPSFLLTFPKDARLLASQDYKQVFDRVDIKVGNQYFLCLTRKNSFNHPRLGLVIAKKQVKLAVGRNKIKRIVRDSFRCHQGELPNLDIIFLSRNQIDTLDNQSLHQELEKLWKRLIKKSRNQPVDKTSLCG
ncbi:MAG: ribonuclease P protein component [Cellvibrionales bacterium]|nr:ribonuclease P protein component [Cellvibrionales bacterium]